MVILSLDQPCIPSTEVGARFGTAGPPQPKRPNTPANAPDYVRYPQDWGVVNLGYKDGCLVTVVLDAN
jgi:hypothetical protein